MAKKQEDDGLEELLKYMTKDEIKILETIKQTNLTSKELKELLKGKPKAYGTTEINFTDRHVKFGVISDLHIGHSCYRPDILDHFAKYTKQSGCEFVLIPGDLVEGLSGREGHIYELTHIGATEQIEYGISELSKIQLPIYAITASNSHDGWYHSKGNAGLEVGPILEDKLDNFTFLGKDEADLKLKNGLIIRLVHPGDGTAYSLSYKLQRYINAISGGVKPNILLEGHYHKSLYMFYRNIHAYDCATAESQTIFMRKIGTPAHLGYWVIDVNVGKKGGVNKINMEFIPFYEKNIRMKNI